MNKKKSFYSRKSFYLVLVYSISLFFSFKNSAISSADLINEDIQLIEKNLNQFLKSNPGISKNKINETLNFMKSYNFNGSADVKDISRELIVIGKRMFNSNDKEGSIIIFKESLSLLNTRENRKMLADTLVEIGIFFKDNGEYALAIDFLSRAVDVTLITVDEEKLQKILKILEVLYKWQETKGR